jgi:toxin ParE1/3/4
MFAVHVTQAAMDDLSSILDYLLGQDAVSAASALWQDFEDAFDSLRELPLRGHIPPELADHPDKRIREIHVSVYRLVYRIIHDEVFILFIVDGRRDMQKSLVERALRFGL